MSARRVRSEDVEVGDVLMLTSRVGWRVLALAPYEGELLPDLGEGTRIAETTGGEITLVAGGWWNVK